MVNGLLLVPTAVKVFVDIVVQDDQFLWRPTLEIKFIKNSFMNFVVWPTNRVVYENTTDGRRQKFPPSSSIAGTRQKSPPPSSTTVGTRQKFPPPSSAAAGTRQKSHPP